MLNCIMPQDRGETTREINERRATKGMRRPTIYTNFYSNDPVVYLCSFPLVSLGYKVLNILLM